MAQPSLPRASPRGMGAPCPHLLSFGGSLGLAFRVLGRMAAEARAPVASLWARSASCSLKPVPKRPLPAATLA